MKNTAYKLTLLFLIGFVVVGCGGGQRRQEAIDQLKRMQSATHGLHILVSAGITKQEYSARLEDALLKIGDLDQVAKETVPKFPNKEQAVVAEIFRHIGQSIEAYKDARDYFGEKFTGVECEQGCSLLTQSDYDTEKAKFPTLIDLKPETVWHSMNPDSPPDYYREDMLKALWKVASEEDAAAQNLIGNLK